MRFLRTASLTIVLPTLLLAVSFSPFADAQAAPRVAVVTRTAPMPSADNPYVDHLRGRGWDVSVIDDDRIRNAGKSAIAGYDLVVISSSVYPGRISDRLLTAPEPIIVAEHQLFKSFQLTGRAQGDSGLTTSSRTVDIVKPGSPLAANLNGAVVVATQAMSMNFGVPAPAADVIASVKGAPAKALIFSYDVGDRLAAGSIAKGRRVGFYMSQALPRLANRDAWALFDAAASWLAPEAPGPASVATFGTLTPSDGALLGANVSKENYRKRYEAVRGFEGQLGRDLAIVNRFHEFSSGRFSDFYWDRQHIDDGRTVMVSWRATDNPGSTNGSPDPRRASKIVAGQYDREIDAMAIALRDLEAPVLLRFNWEMDQDRGDPQYIGTPSEFIAAWRYVHRRFQRRGATNVEWVWAPRARSFAKRVGQTFYPGSDFVDWVGGSAVPINSFTDPRTIYGAWNEWAVNIGKPQLIWVGLRENPGDSQWKAGFFDQLRMLTAGEWSGVKALVYYNSNSPLGNDYTIDTSSQSLRAFRTLACDPHYTKTDRC